jgi:AbrB family looped-hinge helix DNA binding protein
MSTTTLSAKFQISIPKEVREDMGLKPGQKFTFLRMGRTLKLVPQVGIDELFGLGRGADTRNSRDRHDRDSRLPGTQARKKPGR